VYKKAPTLGPPCALVEVLVLQSLGTVPWLQSLAWFSIIQNQFSSTIRSKINYDYLFKSISSMGKLLEIQLVTCQYFKQLCGSAGFQLSQLL
jgi:hypothetical protein